MGREQAEALSSEEKEYLTERRSTRGSDRKDRTVGTGSELGLYI